MKEFTQGTRLGSSGETFSLKMTVKSTLSQVEEKVAHKLVSDELEISTIDRSLDDDNSKLSPRDNNPNGLSEMHFVNRLKESMELYESLVEQLRDPKSFMPLVSQLYGSGKTTLVRNFRRILKKKTSLVRYGVIDNAILVHIHLDGSSNPKDKNYILKTFYQEIRLTFMNHKMDQVMDVLQGMINDSREDLGLFLKLYNSNDRLPSLLVCLDEIQTIEWKNDTVGSAQNLLNLWDVLIGALVASKKRKTLFVFVGKTQTPVLLGRGKRAPELQHLPPAPSPSRHIVLRALWSHHIEESVSKTMVGDQSLLQLYSQRGLREEDVSYFCQRLYFYTGGIPRFVYRVCWSIFNKTTIRLNGVRDIDNLFSHNTHLFFTLQNSAEIHLLSSIDGPLSQVLSFIYSLSALGVTFPDDTPIESYQTMTELLHTLPLYIEDIEDKDNPKYLVYRMIFPECLKVNIPFPDPSHGGLLKGLQKYSAILNSGELLEYLTSNTLVLRILMMRRVKGDIIWKHVSPCFSYSENIGHLLVDVNLSEIVFLPKFTCKKSQKLTKDEKEELKTLSWSHDVSVNDWKWVITKMCKVKHFHKPKPMSMSCDLYFLATNDTMVGFAIKNYGQRSSFSVKMLQNEIDKAALSMNGTPIQKFTLFVLCRSHDVLGSLFPLGDTFRMGSGRFVWNKTTFEKDEANTTDVQFTEMKERLRSRIDYHPGTIAIPRGMEVIILGESAFEQFFGEQATSLLKNIAEHCTIQQSLFPIVCEVLESVGMISPETSSIVLNKNPQRNNENLIRTTILEQRFNFPIVHVQIANKKKRIKYNCFQDLKHQIYETMDLTENEKIIIRDDAGFDIESDKDLELLQSDLLIVERTPVEET